MPSPPNQTEAMKTPAKLPRAAARLSIPKRAKSATTGSKRSGTISMISVACQNEGQPPAAGRPPWSRQGQRQGSGPKERHPDGAQTHAQRTVADQLRRVGNQCVAED